MAVITISRQFGCGEMDFANQLADRLHYWLFDRELIRLAAARLDVKPETVAALDERPPPAGILGFMARAGPRAWPRSPEALPADGPSRGVEPRSISAAVRHVILELARQGDAIIVGRGAGFVLEGRSDVLRLRLVAPREDRIGRVSALYGVSQREAETAIARSDRERRLFIRREFKADWDDPSCYDMVLNLGLMPVGHAVDLAAEAARTLDRARSPSEGESVWSESRVPQVRVRRLGYRESGDETA